MQRKEVGLQVMQSIRYNRQGQEADEWLLNTRGTLLELTRYSKISYTDRDNMFIEVKWYPDRMKQHLVVEIKQPHYTLIFNPSIVTRTLYNTPQGEWDLEVLTQNIQHKETDKGLLLIINYQIVIQNEALGDYEFRLHYGDEIGNI